MDGDLLTETKVVKAYRVLFVGVGQFNSNLLDLVQLPEIKKAYRKRALDTHPDRFAWADEDHQRICTERFLEVADAYEILSAYLALRDKGFCFKRKAVRRPAGVWRGRPFHDQESELSRRFGDRPDAVFSFSFWGKGVPGRALRFGEFLYYSGAIPWKALINALVWQRRQRPRIGEIAQRWRWVTEFEILELLKDRRLGERLGEVLIRRSLISPFQLEVLLWHQKKLQKRIGEYFVHQRLLTEDQVRRHLLRQQRHNARFGAPPSCYPHRWFQNGR
jgi:hypothetical protein